MTRDENELKERLCVLCHKGLIERNINDKRHQDRLLTEMREINAQSEHEYFLDLYDRCQKEKLIYPENQNNLLVAYLLKLTNEFDIDQDPVYVQGEYPDIDTDFHPAIRDYIKNDWAPREFGRDYVCSIGNYTTFGIKSSLIDMAKVHGLDRDEILSLTTELGLKDDEGKSLTFDKALELYPKLKEYCEKHPDVANAVRKIANRNRGMGMHAGGLIISSERIDDLVPLVKGKDDIPVSAWVEGLHGQDLGPMGLIKFDFLTITKLEQIALCCKMVKERHNLPHICSDPLINRDWSDTSYLEDEKSLKLAYQGDLLGIFQFDSPGIRRLCQGNVTEFNDMVAINSIYRPGPLALGVHERYFKRKKGEEKYEIHPLLEPILGPTYNLIIYQETIMRLLEVVGNIPPKDCLVALKGISKKQVEKISKYRDMFLRNGQKNLGISEEEIANLFKQIEEFAAYSFNMSHSVAYAYVAMRSLYLKAHYPLEFYTATLACEDNTEKIREYIWDAKKHGVEVRKVDVNRSKEVFSIDEKENCIYFGFQDVKGLGEGVSSRIVAGQPYTSFEDFLQRFGTDSKVVTALISLGSFGEDRHSQCLFYERYRDWHKRKHDREKRSLAKRQEYLETASALVPGIDFSFTDECFAECQEKFPEHMKVLGTIRKKFENNVSLFESKAEREEVPSYHDLGTFSDEVDPKWYKLLSQSVDEVELQFYGFVWSHPLDKSPDFRVDSAFTFHKHRLAAEEGKRTNYVEGIIRSVKEKQTKNGNCFYQLRIEDVNSETAPVTVWEEDYKRFAEELVEKNLVKILLDAPDPPFPTYTLNSPPKWRRAREIPKEKTTDLRVVVYRAL